MIRLEARVVAVKNAPDAGLGIKLIGRPAGESKGPTREAFVNFPYTEDLAKSVYVGRRVTIIIE